MFKTTLDWLFGPKSHFELNEAVKLKDGDNEMMIVTGIKTTAGSEPLIKCKWDRSNEVQVSEFPESRLEPFDWDAAYRKCS